MIQIQPLLLASWAALPQRRVLTVLHGPEEHAVFLCRSLGEAHSSPGSCSPPLWGSKAAGALVLELVMDKGRAGLETLQLVAVWTELEL